MRDENSPEWEEGRGCRQERQWTERFIAHGDEDAFASIYRRYNARLYAFLLRLLAWDAPLAQDALQETWLRAVRSLSTFRWESALFYWLRGIALNHCRELWRAQIKREESRGELAERTAHVYGTQSGLAIDLERAIAQLAQGFRTVLILHDIEGLTHEQIAQQLGIASGTSKSQLSRARRQVRRHLAGQSGIDPSPREEK